MTMDYLKVVEVLSINATCCQGRLYLYSRLEGEKQEQAASISVSFSGRTAKEARELSWVMA